MTECECPAVWADDVLVNGLGRVMQREPSDAELARVLLAWRREVDAEPIGPPVRDVPDGGVR